LDVDTFECILNNHLQQKDNYLEENSRILIPKCLKIVENFKNDEKINGFKILKILIQKSNKTDLLWFDELLINVLHENMKFRETSIVENSLICVNQLLKEIGNEKYFEIFLEDYLQSCEYLNDVEQRRVYLIHLNEFFDLIGILSVKYFKVIY
jgi:hypothetical protein